MLINYAINRKTKKGFEHTSGLKIDLPRVTEENWQTSHTYVREEIQKLVPEGWLITGWAYPENKIYNAIKRLFPEATNEESDSLLWGATSYPAGDENQILKDIEEAAKEGNNNIAMAMAWADEVTNKSMQEIHEIERFAESLGIPEESLRENGLWLSTKTVMKASCEGKHTYSIIKTSELEQLREELQRLQDMTCGEDNGNTD